jgi:hypothetical protein
MNTEQEKQESIRKLLNENKARLDKFNVLKKASKLTTVDKFAMLQCEYTVKMLEKVLQEDSPN